MRMLSLGIAGMLCGLTTSPRNVAAQDAADGTSVLALGANGSVALSVQGKELCKWTPTAANTEWRFSEGIKTGRSPEGNPQFGLMASAAIQGETSLSPKAGSAEVSWTFRAKEAVSFNTLAVATSLPLESLDGGTWKADDAGGAFPAEYGGEKIFGGSVSRLEVTTVDGRAFKLRFAEPTHIGIQDNRRWGAKSFTIRVGQVFGKLTAEKPYRLSFAFELPGKVEFRNDEEVVIMAGQDWVPLTAFLDIVPGSALDLSGILPARQACGSKGRVIATPDGHFAFADEPTKPHRFYGPNLCFSSQYMSKENVDILLDRWVRMGYNTLRIHHYEFGLTTPIWKSGFDWDAKKLDQLCYLIAGCAKRGIWITTDLYVSRPVTPVQLGVPAE
jgi:hypothetical protein